MSLCITRAVNASDRSRLEVVPATEHLCGFLARGLRKCDIAEAAHTVGSSKSAEEAMIAAMELSQNPRIAKIDGVPFAMFGCERRDGFGEPWMLGSTIVDEFPKLVFKEAKRLVGLWAKEHGRLCNIVWAESRSVRWLARLGFALSEEMPIITHDGETEQYRVFMLEDVNVLR